MPRRSDTEALGYWPYRRWKTFRWLDQRQYRSASPGCHRWDWQRRYSPQSSADPKHGRRFDRWCIEPGRLEGRRGGWDRGI